MNCLNCDEEMMNIFVQTKQQNIAYDVCEKCGSLWLDKGELDKLAFQVDGSIEFSSQEPIDRATEQAITCPRCEGKALDRVRFIGHSEITLDRCSSCGGFWLDGGEIDSINRELKETMPVHGSGFSDFLIDVHIPYWHKRIKSKSSETDFEVEVLPIKGAEVLSPTDYQCPACKSSLNQYGIFGIEFEGCPRCKGVFLDCSELRKLKDKATNGSWRTLQWMDDEVEAIERTNMTLSNRFCPKCDGIKLLTTSFGDSEVLIDYCTKCNGIWLDRDEFQEIMRHLNSQLMKFSSKEMAGKVYEEIKEIWNGPENVISEILDAKAAISALINITIFENPALHAKIQSFGDAAKGIGLG